MVAVARDGDEQLVATGEIPIRGQLLDDGSPPNQIPASQLPHHDHASGHQREWFVGRVRNGQNASFATH